MPSRNTAPRFEFCRGHVFLRCYAPLLKIMNRVTHLNLKRVLTLGPVVVLGFTSLLAFNGCSSDDQPTEPSTGGTGTAGRASATGGTGGTGAAGTPGTGGTTSAGGMPGTGGASGGASGGTAGSGSMVPLPMPAECTNLTTTLNNGCAKIGCHKGTFASAGLDLTPNNGLVGRVKDIAATHKDIICPGSTESCVPSTCPSGVKLVDSSNAMNSWIITKLEGMQNGCGDSMPGSGTTITAADKTCIEALVNAIAALPK